MFFEDQWSDRFINMPIDIAGCWEMHGQGEDVHQILTKVFSLWPFDPGGR